MAGRLGRSFYRFSSVNRPAPPPTGAGQSFTQDSAQTDARNWPSVTRDQPAVDPTSPRRARSPPAPYSPTRESLPPSPTYSVKKAASPPSSPTYRPSVGVKKAASPPSSPTYRPTVGVKKAASPPSSPTYRPTVGVMKAASPPSSPTYRPTAAVKKTASPPSSPPTYRPTASSRPISSPPKPAAEYSPKFKQTYNHTQPRSPPEVEQKPVIYKAVEKPAKSDSRHQDYSGKSSLHKQQPNAVRIAGENLGAVMEIVQSPKKGAGQIIRKKESTRGTHNIGHENDEASQGNQNQKGKETTTSLPNSTFLNSNFQTVNNSLLYNASVNHHDPGLHLSFSKKPTGDRSAINEDKKHMMS